VPEEVAFEEVFVFSRAGQMRPDGDGSARELYARKCGNAAACR